MDKRNQVNSSSSILAHSQSPTQNPPAKKANQV